jgi:hypothetical protein
VDVNEGDALGLMARIASRRQDAEPLGEQRGILGRDGLPDAG